MKLLGRVWSERVTRFCRGPSIASMWGASVLREVATASVNKPPTQLCFSQCFQFVTMDFLKSAVASAISKGYPTWGYTFGDRVDIDDSIWTLHNGTKRVWPWYLTLLQCRADCC